MQRPLGKLLSNVDLSGLYSGFGALPSLSAVCGKTHSGVNPILLNWVHSRCYFMDPFQRSIQCAAGRLEPWQLVARVTWHDCHAIFGPDVPMS